MLKLLIKIPFNRQLKEDEKIQIGFDKKNYVERIFNQDNEDIYFDKKTKLYYKTGSLFLNYLSDDVSELYMELMNDICKKMQIDEIRIKYINTYTFYLKYFFYNFEKDIKNIELLEESKLKDLIDKVIIEIKIIEESKTVKELMLSFRKVYTKLFRGNKIYKGEERKKSILGREKSLMNITRYFLDKAYLKQLYKLLIEYCYFREKTIQTENESNKTKSRFVDFKNEYLNLYQEYGGDEIPQYDLSFNLPKSKACIYRNGNIAYTYLIDEKDELKEDRSGTGKTNEEIKLMTYIDTFFSLSLLELLESDKKIEKCKNCGRYFILIKKGTLYCNNPSPQNNNRTCSSYMKEYNYRNNIKKDEEKEEIQKEIKKAKDRLYSYTKSFKDIKTEEGRKYYNREKEKLRGRINSKKEEYENKKITAHEFITWLKEN